MKKKLFAFLLAAVMVTALLPTVAFAGEPTKVTEISVSIEYPEVGKEFSTEATVVSEPENSVTVSSVKWQKIAKADYIAGLDTLAWTAVEEGEVAASGFVYMPKITIKPVDSGYTVEGVTVTLNETTLYDYNGTGQKEECCRVTKNAATEYVDAWGYIVDFVNTNQVTKYWITINTPQIGKTLDYAPKTEIDPEGSITDPAVNWYKASKNETDPEWIPVEKDEVVEEGYLYGVRLVGALYSGYSVAEDVSVKVNGKDFSNDATARESYSVFEGKLSMNAYFEPTAAADETTTTAAETSADETNPKTGDNSNMFLWIALMAAGAAAAGVAVANRRKFSGR